MQVKFNILHRGQAALVMPVCYENGITPVFYGALADGILTGKFTASTIFGKDDHRSRMPDFQGKRFTDNLKMVDAIRPLAASRNAAIGQMALKWILDEIDKSVVLFGAKTEIQAEENIRSMDVCLSDEDRLFIRKLRLSQDDT